MFKKLLVFVGAVVLVASVACATVESPTNAIDVVTVASNSIQSTITGILPLVATVIIAALGLWLIPRAMRWIKGSVGR